jgi:hypothetical protein
MFREILTHIFRICRYGIVIDEREARSHYRTQPFNPTNPTWLK